jgi:hypothetical protein
MKDEANTNDPKAMPPASFGSVGERITEYLSHGGLFNPELMQHQTVRDLLIDCRCEIDRLREAIRRLAEQDATLSVCDGNVTVEMDAAPIAAEPVAWSLFLNGERARVICDKEDAMRFVNREPKYTLAPLYDHPPQPTLTDAEREAIEDAIRRLWGFDCAATLRGLLERTKND